MVISEKFSEVIVELNNNLYIINM